MHRTRDYRRWQVEKRREKWRRILRHRHRTYHSQLGSDPDPRMVGIHGHTPKTCSNPHCCGNPRHGGWGTMRMRLKANERRALEAYLHQMVEARLMSPGGIRAKHWP